MMEDQQNDDAKIIPGLFGLSNSNRDFTQRTSWGKNQFNSSFPASLACYIYSQGLELVYLSLDQTLKVTHQKINTAEIFGISPSSSNLFFAFESDYVHYRKLINGRLPRVDLVTMDMSRNNLCLRAIEIKLTALPDNSTYNLSEEFYGCELVVRPDTIVYLALSIANHFQDSRQELLSYLEPICSQIQNWASIESILAVISGLVNSLDSLLIANLEKQQPLVLQPIWKTLGKTSRLYNNCLDIFVWSDFYFTRLFVDITQNFIDSGTKTIQRSMRSLVWLVKMLYDFAKTGKISHQLVIDSLTYNTKNDKAFALSGKNTHKYMACSKLLNPRITRADIKNIILGGGQNFLSPERRFDAIILSNPEIFE